MQPDPLVLQAPLCGFRAFVATESQWALACGSVVTSHGSRLCLPLGDQRDRSEVYTDLPMLRGIYIPPRDAAKWAPEWSPSLRGRPPLSVFAPPTQGGKHR